MNFNELKQRFERTPEEEQAIKAKILQNEREDKKRKEAEKLRRFEEYIKSLPKRFQNSSFENFLIRLDGGLQKEKEQVQSLKGGLMFGQNGNGKTHLGYSACREVVKQGGTAKLIRAFNFFTEVKDCYGSNSSINKVIDKYAKLDYLVIDECDKTRGSQDEFINIVELINRRYEQMLPTLIISNHNSLKEIEEVFTVSCTDKLQEHGIIEMKYGTTRRKETQQKIKEKQEKIQGE